MKFSKLLVLSALWLIGLGANAQVELIDRVAPVAPDWNPRFDDQGTLTVDDNVVQTPATFEVGKFYVLFNKDRELYFSQGCSWSTQAAADVTPIVVRFTLPDGKTLADGALLLNDFNLYTGKWNLAFFDSATGIFTDRNTQSNFYWNVIDQGNNTYRLQASEANPDFTPTKNPGFVGLDDATQQGGDTHGRGIGADAYALSPFLSEGDGHSIDWYFYALTGMEEWDEYHAGLEIYNQSVNLKKAIETAEADTEVDIATAIAAAVDVYNNEGATAAELAAATEALNNARNAAHENILNGASASNPKDASYFIVNPDFDNVSSEGWSGTAPGLSGDGNHGAAGVAEHYNKTFNTYQELEGMPAGIYRLSAKTGFRGSYDDFKNNTNNVAKLYAVADGDTLTTDMNNLWSILNTVSFVEKYGSTTYFETPNAEGSTTDGVTYYIPNNPSTFRLYYEEEDKNYYDTNVFFAVEEGKAVVGVRKDSKVTDTDWAMFDKFALTYYGAESAEGFQVWLQSAKKSFEGLTYTTSYFEAYAEKFDVTVTSKADVLAAIASAEEPLDSLKKNINLWSQYVAKVAEAETLVADLNDVVSEIVDDLSDYVEWDYEEIIEALELTNEEILEEIAKVEAMIKATNNLYKAGDDLTARFLKNADFSNGNTGWNKAKDSRPGLAFRETIAEAYDTDFDLYQEVTNVQKGVYEVSLQGFFRMARSSEAWTKYQNNEQVTDAGVYINDNKTSLKCIFDEGLEIGSDEEAAKKGGWMNNEDAAFSSGKNYPDDMASASYAFGLVNGDNERYMYQNKAYGLVSEEGQTIRVGIKGDVRGANWICFDNLHLKFLGMDANTIAPILQAALDNLPRTDEMMTKTTYEKFAAVKADANAAIQANDGSAMFEALTKIYALSDEVANSVAICKALNEKAEDLAAEADNPVNSAFKTDALLLVEEIQNKLTGKQMEDAEIATYEVKLMEMRTNLMLNPEYAGATVDDPVDQTAVIVTPSYEIGGANSIKGWNADGYNFGNDDTQKSALLLEFYNKTFDLNQTIYGLPAGYYLLGVNAFCRVGGNAEDFAAYAAKPDSTEAYVYAQHGETIDSIGVACMAKFALTEDLGIDGQGTYEKDGVTYYVPGSMVSSNAFFEMGYYQNDLLVKINAGEALRFGIMKKKNTNTGWVIMDNWTLKYVGTNDDVATAIEVAKAQTGAENLKVEFFSVDGRRVNAAFKGIAIQKITKADGTVVVKKVRK
ncbi:MAG: hypothetical protein IJV34_04630 [Prevotella sp.]|nr:hypothetical protein [Prevotella sp.]